MEKMWEKKEGDLHRRMGEKIELLAVPVELIRGDWRMEEKKRGREGGRSICNFANEQIFGFTKNSKTLNCLKEYGIPRNQILPDGFVIIIGDRAVPRIELLQGKLLQ
ncbi:hypothetical protein ACH5RR_039111 [Cinchona calisaya]|uniref:RCK C-terminal domain-containing protein n=1 Tax=Cinchona calisaya TaxID=153742 RepID=A0ABD2XYP6_9GENT